MTSMVPGGMLGARRRRCLFCLLAVLAAASGEASDPPGRSSTQRSALIAKQIAQSLFHATQRVVAKQGIPWTSTAGRSALSALGAVVRSVLRRAVTKLRNVHVPDDLTPTSIETAFISGEMNSTKVVVRGLHTLTDFRVAALDAEHFTVTSTLDSLNSSMIVDLRARMLLGRLLHTTPVEARFAVLSQLKKVTITTRWHCPLTPETLRVLLQCEDGPEGSAESRKAQRALRPRIVGAEVRIEDAVVALQQTQVQPDALGASAPLLWRLASAACAARLREALEEQLARKVLKAVREANG